MYSIQKERLLLLKEACYVRLVQNFARRTEIERQKRDLVKIAVSKDIGISTLIAIIEAFNRPIWEPVKEAMLRDALLPPSIKTGENAQKFFQSVYKELKKSQELKRALEQGEERAKKTVNYSNTVHPPVPSLQNSVEFRGDFTPEQQKFLEYMLRASEQTAETINKFREAPLSHSLQRIEAVPKMRAYGDSHPSGYTRISRSTLKNPERLVQTLGHEIAGHDLMAGVEQNISLGVPGGFEEFLAENNSAHALINAADLALRSGDKASSDIFVAAAKDIFRNIKYYGEPQQTAVRRDQAVANALDRQIRKIPAVKKENPQGLAEHIGQHAFLANTPPSKVLGTRLNEIRKPTIPSKEFNTWSLEGIPIMPDLVPAYKRYLEQFDAASTRAFKNQ